MGYDKHCVSETSIDRIITNIDGLYENFIKKFKDDPDSIHYLLMMKELIDKYITLLQAKEKGREIFYFDDVKPVSQDQVDTWRRLGSYCDDFSEYEKIPLKIEASKRILSSFWNEEGYYIEFYGLEDDETDFTDSELVDVTEKFYKWEDEVSDAAEFIERNNILVYRLKYEDE